MILSSLRVNGHPVRSLRGAPLRHVTLGDQEYRFAEGADAVCASPTRADCPDSVEAPFRGISVAGNTLQETGETTVYDIHGFTKKRTQLAPDMNQSGTSSGWWSTGEGRYVQVVSQSTSSRTVRFPSMSGLPDDYGIPIGYCTALPATVRSHKLYVRMRGSATNVGFDWYAYTDIGGYLHSSSLNTSVVLAPNRTSTPYVTLYARAEQFDQNSQFTFSLEIFDLTEDFGAGKEPSTTTQCERYYGSAYISSQAPYLYAKSPVQIGNTRISFSGALKEGDVLCSNGTLTQDGVETSFTGVLCEAGQTVTDGDGYTLTAESRTVSIPDPAYPRDLSYGMNIRFSLNGKNLWQPPISPDLVRNADGSYTFTVNGSRRITSPFGAFPAGVYTIRCTLIGGKQPDCRFLKITAGAASSTVSGKMTNPGGKTITLQEDAYYFELYVPSTSPNGSYCTFRDLQIESGAVATAYQPYQEPQSVPIPSTVSIGGETVTLLFAKVGNVADTLTVANGQVKYVSRICRILSYAGEQIETPYMSTTGALTEGATVLYVREAPREYDLSATETGQALLALHTYEGTTTFQCVTAVDPSAMPIGYFRQILPQVP